MNCIRKEVILLLTLPSKHDVLMDTPVLTVDLDIMERNMIKMASIASKQGVALRPHNKTHKSPQIARKQLELGAVGITVAKLQEAEVMLAHGIDNIQITFPVVGDVKIDRLFKIMDYARELRVVIDDLEAAKHLSQRCVDADRQVKILAKVNTGGNRLGVKPGEETLELAKALHELPGLEFTGLLSHAGQVYDVISTDEIPSIGRREGEDMVQTAELLEKNGVPVKIVSVGSSPGAEYCSSVAGVTEIRPGSYIFRDGKHVSLGAASYGECALKLRARVCSTAVEGQAVIDAGTKTFTRDYGPDLGGYGKILDHPGATLAHMAEEHGMIEYDESKEQFQVGDILEIIPNHACGIVNNFHHLVGVRGGEVEEIFQVSAQGMLK